MGNASDKTLARILKLQTGIQKNIVNAEDNGEKQAGEYADILQAILEKKEIHIGAVAVRVVDLSIPSSEVQIKRWKEANEKGKLGIPEEAFGSILDAPELTEKDKQDGFIGACLFYGFGDVNGKADPLASGENSWEYAKLVHKKNAQSEYVKFKEKWMRLRPEAKPRETGFFWRKVILGTGDYQGKCVRDSRKMFHEGDTGMAFEGIQLLAVIIPDYVEQMNGKDKPYIDLADYEVAPYGDSVFYEAPCLDLGGGRLGIGSGHVGYVDSRFGSGVLR
uniref:Uncharacterized protein n=1 Tax=candidate division CPR3 bacterium TaxID=2268181 RepID=A0A7C4M0S7_UNCC3